MKPIIGREEEQRILEYAFKSEQPEFIAIYGRRRVGKTYLVTNTFQDRANTLYFYMTGTNNGLLEEQLQNFTRSLETCFGIPTSRHVIPQNWHDAFGFLTNYIQSSKGKTIVLFFDEFPWMATPNSRLLQTLEYYWNQYWSHDQRIKLIICGSSASWILDKIVNNRGGLYNRMTKSIQLEPFTLHQTKQYLTSRKISLPNTMIIHLYMVLGGIPFYLSKIEPGLSAIQIIEGLAFKKNSFLFKEFENLYATLFGADDGHIELARIISKHRYGIGSEELTEAAQNISSGGGLVRKLKELEEAGFIKRIKPFQSKMKGVYYKMIDEYSLFYFYWIESIKDELLNSDMPKGYWTNLQHSPAWHSWAGYTFESICYRHIHQIHQALKLSPLSLAYAWRYAPPKRSAQRGAQIDLLFNRDDSAITVCEIKYTEQPFAIDKSYAKELERKMEVFKERIGTEKHLFLAFVCSNGLKPTMYSEDLVSSVVTSDDLFKKIE